MSDPNATMTTYQQGEPMSPNPNNYYSYPRQYFTDSVGRPFSDKHWADFAQAMDKYALSYANNLEKVLAEKYS